MDAMARTKLLVFFRAIVYTLIVIGIFGGIGYYLDLRFGTSPKILIASIVISYPITQIVLLKKIRKFAKKKLELPTKAKK